MTFADHETTYAERKGSIFILLLISIQLSSKLEIFRVFDLGKYSSLQASFW